MSDRFPSLLFPAGLVVAVVGIGLGIGLGIWLSIRSEDSDRVRERDLRRAGLTEGIDVGDGVVRGRSESGHDPPALGNLEGDEVSPLLSPPAHPGRGVDSDQAGSQVTDPLAQEAGTATQVEEDPTRIRERDRRRADVAEGIDVGDGVVRGGSGSGHELPALGHLQLIVPTPIPRPPLRRRVDSDLAGSHVTDPPAQEADTATQAEDFEIPPGTVGVRQGSRGQLAVSIVQLSAGEPPAPAKIETLGPPPGFEDLLAPQTTVVDVHFGGRLAGSAVATFAPGTFSFDDPASVMQLIPGVASPTLVERALTGRLDPNPDLVCGETNRDACGELQPEVAGIIFDAGRFQVDVFVNPTMLAVQAQDIGRFLSPAETGFSGITAIAGAISGTTDTDNQFNLRNRSILAYRDARIRLDSSLSSDDDLFFDTAFAEYDQPGTRFAGGLFRTQGVELVGEEKIYGGYVGTSFDTRTDLDQVTGTQLTLFVPRRSQVDIIRDGRLISSELLEAGNQVLDTSLLPNGAYDVTLRVREVGGGEREEIRFFVKSLAIPPKDSPIYFLEGGLRADDADPEGRFPVATSTPLLRGGTRHRITDGLAIGGGFLTSDSQALLEASALHVSRFAQVRLAGLTTTDKDLGLSAGVSGRLAGISYSLTGRRVWAGDKVASAAVDTEEFDPIVGSFQEARGSLSYRRGNVTLGFRGNWRQDNGAADSYSFGPTLNYTILRDRRLNLSLRAEAARTQDEDVALARLRLSFNGTRYSASATGGYRAENARSPDATDDSGALADGSLTWRDRDVVPGDLAVTASAFREPGQNTVQLGSDYASQLGRYSIVGAYEERADNEELRYSGTGALNWLSTPNGVVIGGRDSLGSAVIIAVGGTAQDAEFEVLIDERPRGTVRVGQRLPISLPPYETYNIRVRPTDAALVDFDGNERAVTLYPGNVAHAVWEAHPLRAIYGQALAEDGSPIAFSRITGAVGEAVSDDLGYFQAEVGSVRDLLFRRPDGNECTVALDDLPADQDLVSLGTVTCE